MARRVHTVAPRTLLAAVSVVVLLTSVALSLFVFLPVSDSASAAIQPLTLQPLRPDNEVSTIAVDGHREPIRSSNVALAETAFPDVELSADIDTASPVSADPRPLNENNEFSPESTANTEMSDELTPEVSVERDPACEGTVSPEVMDRNIGASNGIYGGGDYQRAFALGDGRVLWVLQDAFLQSVLVHNAAFIQDGTCFELLNNGTDNWLYEDETRSQERWFWIFDANVITERQRVELVVAEMIETGPNYLSRVRIAGTTIVTVDSRTLEFISAVPFQSNPDIDSDTHAPAFFGWSIVDNAGDGYRYLWGHCYAQFGFDGLFGFGACLSDMYLARVHGRSITGVLEYWDGSDWSTDPAMAKSTINFFVTGAGNNPGDIAYEPQTDTWHLIMKPDDWWGDRVIFATADHPAGPWVMRSEVDTVAKCGECTTYYASWIPGHDSPRSAWSLGHNHWHVGHTSYYFPTFHAIDNQTLVLDAAIPDSLGPSALVRSSQ